MSIAMNVPAEMRKRYLERRQRDAAALSEAFAKGDLDLFLKIGHQLKGNAATFGYDDLAAIGIRMEESVESGDRAATEACLEDFHRWVRAHFKPDP